jgi:8-oxo-dGTP diphosphatase
MSKAIKVKVVVVVLTISEGALKTLLVRRDRNFWSLPSGQPKHDEPLHDAAERITQEKVGITVDYLEQLYTFGDNIPAKSERMIEVSYYGLVPSTLLRFNQLTDHQSASWFSEHEQPRLAEDHAMIVKTARDRLRGKLAYTAVGFELLPDQFTLGELQNLYEVILGKEIDKRNFRRKINELGILERLGKARTSRAGRGRPAALFKFKHDVFKALDAKGDIFPF